MAPLAVTPDDEYIDVRARRIALRWRHARVARLPSRPTACSVQLYTGGPITPPHRLTPSRRTLTRGPARSLAMPKHEDVRERANLVHLLGEEIDADR